MILDLSILLTAALIVLMGATVYINNPRYFLNISLAGLATTVSIWLLANLLVIIQPNSLIVQQLITPTSTACLIALMFFIDNYDSQRKPHISNFFKVTIAGAIPILVLSFTSANVAKDGDTFTFGFLYPYYIVFTIITCVLVLFRILYNQKTLNESNKVKTRLVNLGIVLTVIPSVIFGVVLPLMGFSQISNFTPIFTLVFFAFTTTAILKNGLFDIRNVVLRLLAYSISLGIIVLLFVFLAFNLTSLVFGGQLISFNLQIYYVITAMIVTLLYGQIKKFVDQGTNRLFFQQDYSVHEAINKISTFSTRSVDPHSIQQNALRVIEETIAPDYAGFIVYDINGKLKPSSHIGNFPTKSLSLSPFLAQLSGVKPKITFAEDVQDSRSHMKEYFELSNIRLIVRLSTNNKSIGYLVLGDKKNGNSYSRHDLQLLTLAANDLALALQNAIAFEEIRAFNNTLQAKVNKATDALKRTNDKLVALDDTKDEFISMASHQLRTPLTSIKGYISMMLEGDLGKINETQRKALEEAFNSSQRMVFLISDFLNVSRIRTGKFVIEKNETDLNKIVLEEISQLRDLAGLRDQTIDYIPQKNFPIVELDETKTRQVMMNFIDNAIFYTPKNGKIHIVLEKTSKEIVFKVTDTGIGVPKNVQHRLFTKFFRAENARNARPDGTGLGLFMGQKIIDAQGGKVIFHSVEHEGSTFGFRFPLKIIHDA